MVVGQRHAVWRVGAADTAATRWASPPLGEVVLVEGRHRCEPIRHPCLIEGGQALVFVRFKLVVQSGEVPSFPGHCRGVNPSVNPDRVWVRAWFVSPLVFFQVEHLGDAPPP